MQVAVLIVVTLVAYNYSLTTLLQTANQDTPVRESRPAIALALAAIRARPPNPSRQSTTGKSIT